MVACQESLEWILGVGLSRAEAGLRGATFIVNLPGSLKAVQDGMDVLIPLLPHALEMIAGKGH